MGGVFTALCDRREQDVYLPRDRIKQNRRPLHREVFPISVFLFPILALQIEVLPG